MRRESESDRTVAAVLRKQGGLITRAQVLAAGWSEGTLRHRIRPDGPWLAVLPGIYLGCNGQLAGGQREIAAVLYAGPGCVLTGPASLQHQGVRVPATEMIDVRALVAGAVQAGKCTVPQLAQELKSGPRRSSSRLRTVLEEVADGMASAAEGDLRQLIKRSGLPVPMYNPDLYVGSRFLARPDAWWKDAGVAAEVDSREWHLGPEQWQKTMARHDLMGAHGIIVIHFTPRQLKTEGRRIAAELKSAIDAGRRRPPLKIRVEPRR
jgi:hypothetical protein